MCVCVFDVSVQFRLFLSAVLIYITGGEGEKKTDV